MKQKRIWLMLFGMALFLFAMWNLACLHESRLSDPKNGKPSIENGKPSIEIIP